ncbi:GNAT family N-acetyltransferase [Niallia nealsonii]|uniref:GNAT family N-acetyltransferase n=2 Tax=Niallia nealsonii TaxID=115979 RepID=A0A2N0Z0I0_9BACI|nr:GNAT family N-acetyltransferase [Niallia nealsonii]
MAEKDFPLYQKTLVKEYAKDKIKAGTWAEEGALQKAEEQLQTLLPKGVHSPCHYFLSITKEPTKEIVGYLWYHLDLNNRFKEAFIYDFVINEKEQGKGYGTKALEILDDHIKQQGGKKITLHVFAHNEKAIHLYKKMQFQTRDLVMSKDL